MGCRLEAGERQAGQSRSRELGTAEPQLHYDSHTFDQQGDIGTLEIDQSLPVVSERENGGRTNTV